MEPFWSLIVGIYGIFEGSWGSKSLLRGSWDLVTRVIIKVTILIITYNPT